MRGQHNPILLALFAFCSLQMARAQTSTIINQTNLNYILFKATDYTNFYTSASNESRWILQGEGPGTPAGIRADGTLSPPGKLKELSSDKAYYLLNITNQAVLGTTYRLYVRAYHTGTGANNSFFFSDVLGSPDGTEFNFNNLSETPSWFDIGNGFTTFAGTFPLLLFPRQSGLVITDILLYRGTDVFPEASEIDGLGLVTQSPQTVTVSNLAATSEPDPGNMQVEALSLNNSQSTGVTAVSSGQGTTTFFSYAGSSYYQLTPQGTGNDRVARLTSQPIFLSCYSPVNMIRLKACFKWFLPNTPNLSDKDILTARLYYVDENGVEITGPNIGSQFVNKTNSNNLTPGTIRYVSECSGDIPLYLVNSALGSQRAILEIRWQSNSDDPIYVDDISITVSGATEPSLPVAGFNTTPVANSAAVIFGNTSQPNAATLRYFWDFGDGTNTTDNTGNTQAFTHNFFQAGSYNVCLTAAYCGQCGTAVECRVSSTTCQTVVVQAPLPVTLTRFTAKPSKQDVELAWETATEINNDYFQVEHSTDGIRFRELGRVDGAGDSQAPLQYSWIHNGAPSGVNYYRLKQVDFDGAFEYSDVVSVLMAGDNEIRLFPNPARDAVQVVSGRDEAVDYVIFDGFGRVLRRGMVPSQGTIDLSGLAPGIYHARLESVGGALLTVERIVKAE